MIEKYPTIKKHTDDVINLHQNWKKVPSNTWAITRSNIQIIDTTDLRKFNTSSTMDAVKESTIQIGDNITTKSSTISLAADVVTSNRDLSMCLAISTSIDEIAEWILNYLKNQNTPQDILLKMIPDKNNRLS